MSFTKTFLLILFISVKSVFAQTLTYDIVLFNKKIGETSVSKIEKGNGFTLYKLNSQSEAKFLFITKQSRMSADILFKDGELYSSSFYVNNDEGEVTRNLKRLSDCYEMETNGVKRNLRRSIRHSSVQLYFSEPTILTAIFSERLGEFFDLEKVAPSEYKSVVKNVSSFYRYKNGKLVELEMSKPTGSAFLKLVN